MYPEVILSHHNLDNLFKEDLVSIPDNELMESKLKKFCERLNNLG
jgi:hypothetical protein